jgi:hypothetical protein
MSVAIRSTMTDATPDRTASYPPGDWGGNGTGRRPAQAPPVFQTLRPFLAVGDFECTNARAAEPCRVANSGRSRRLRWLRRSSATGARKRRQTPQPGKKRQVGPGKDDGGDGGTQDWACRNQEMPNSVLTSAMVLQGLTSCSSPGHPAADLLLRADADLQTYRLEGIRCTVITAQP